ncbi:MAG: ATP-binding protein [Adlercreutzia sp.]|nr:ATP-binding protein [Adlercreutzia sp.]
MEFFGRHEELKRFQRQFSDSKSATLIYGKRRVGKTTLIRRAAESFPGNFLYYECVRSSIRDNLDRLTRLIAELSQSPYLHFNDFSEPFAFLSSLGRKTLVVIDEYQYLKSLGREGEIDSLFQAAIDAMGDGVHVVLSGSYISVMKELLEEDNPLFGRFGCMINLKEFGYLDASRFATAASAREKAELYSVFGGLPFACSKMDSRTSLRENICSLLLENGSPLRTYMEYVLFSEVSKVSNANRVLESLGNGKKRYTEIEASTHAAQNGATDKHLKMLLGMQAIEKIQPINRIGDAKKTFYTIADNLVRFYYTFVFGNENYIEIQGPKGYYDSTIEPAIEQFISRRFEGIAREYFAMEAKRGGNPRSIADVGTFWYDDREKRANGEFDIALRHLSGAYSFYEAKAFSRPMTKTECDAEAAQVRRAANLTGIEVASIGFVSLEGFDFDSDEYDLITGADLYA